MKKENKKHLFEMMEKLNPDIKKKRISESKIKWDVEFNEEKTLSVVFFGDCKMIDVGIGSYEFWGSPGFDSRLVAECDNIRWDHENFTEEENTIIKKYLDANFDEILEEIEQKYEEEGGDDAYR